MVTEYGMSDILGPQQLGQKQGEVFLGRDYGHRANYSNEVAGRIDEEVRMLIDQAHSQARAILTTHRATLDKLAASLVEKETLDTPELMDIIGKLAPWPSANGNGNGKPNRRASTDRRRVSRPAAKSRPKKRASSSPGSRRHWGRSSSPAARTPTATACS